MNDSPYVVRPAERRDADRLVDLLLALQEHIEACNPNLWQMKEEAQHNLKGQIIARLEASDSCALVAEHQEAGVIGVILGRVQTNNRYTPSRAGLIDQTFVHEEHRRAGIGSLLVAELLCFFSAREVEDLSLRYVVGNEEATEFWSALGFDPRIITAGGHLPAVESHLTATTPP